jgi:hypothetical protein
VIHHWCDKTQKVEGAELCVIFAAFAILLTVPSQTNANMVAHGGKPLERRRNDGLHIWPQAMSNRHLRMVAIHRFVASRAL